MVPGKARPANGAARRRLQSPGKPQKLGWDLAVWRDMTRVFIAGIFHESHSFSGDTTGLDKFVIHRGEEIRKRRGDGSQVDGFLSVAEREGWELVPSAVYTG